MTRLVWVRLREKEKVARLETVTIKFRESACGRGTSKLGHK